eukprot:1784578-Alexandrium_andersonii.AAC.1
MLKRPTSPQVQRRHAMRTASGSREVGLGHVSELAPIMPAHARPRRRRLSEGQALDSGLLALARASATLASAPALAP